MLTGKINRSLVLFFIIVILAVPLFSYGAEKIIPDDNEKGAERYYYTDETAQAGKEKKDAPPPLELTPSNRQEIEMKDRFSGPKIKKVDEEYFSIEVADTHTFWEEPGLPLLPVKAAKILIPQGCEVKNISVIPGKKITLDGEFRIEYSRQQIPMSRPDLVVKTEPNRDIYDSPAPFPGKFYSEVSTQFLRGYKILILNLYPVQYRPMYGEISYYPDMKLIVTTTPAKPVPGYRRARCRNKPDDISRVRKAIDNPSLIDTYIEEEREGKREEEGDALPAETLEATPLTLTGGPYEYVIITTQALASTFQVLADHKKAPPRGLTAIVVTVDGTNGIYANYPGEDNQTRIRNFIDDAYSNWDTDYVVLGGDGDGNGNGGAGEVIPHRGVYGYVEAQDGTYKKDKDIPCDLYYGALDGTWNNDGDGTYGESNDGVGGGEVDLMAEVCIGRIACDNSIEAANQINKIIAYENSTHGKKVLLIGAKLDDFPTWGGDYKDEVYTYFPESWSSTKLYDSSKNAVVNAMNSNQHHIVNHAGHANNTSIQYTGIPIGKYLDNTDIDKLSNTTYFLAYSQGCYSNAFDNRTDGIDGNPPYTYTEDAISEHFTVKKASGAFAYIGNTRYGWYASGSTNGASQQFDKQFFDAIFDEGKTNLGVAFEDSRQDLIAWVLATGAMRWCYFELCLMGDPETSFTNILPDLTLTEPDISFSNPTPPPGETITINAVIHNYGENYNYPVLFLSQESDDGFGYPVFDGQWVAQSFLVGSQDITVAKIFLNLLKIDASAGKVSIEIQSDSGGSPSGNKIGSVSNSNTITSGKWWKFTFTTNPALTKNTRYWIVAKSNSPSTQRSGWLHDSTNPYGGGEEKRDRGYGWESTGCDATFRIYDGKGLAAIKFYDGDPDSGGTLIGTDYLTPILALGSATASVQWEAKACTHNIYVVIDPNNYLAESEENNNKSYKAITVEPSLSVSADPEEWKVGLVEKDKEKCMSPGEKIGICNNSDVNETFTLQVTNTGGVWFAAPTEDGNTYNTFVMSGLFTSTTALGSIACACFNEGTDDDVIRSDIAKTASDTIFGCSTESAENGADVPPTGLTPSRTLWLQFKAPTETSTYEPQNIRITVGAEYTLCVE